MTVTGEKTLPRGVWEIDPVHSAITFSIRHMIAAKARGRFNKFSGTFTVADPIENSTAEVVIEAASIDTSHPDRDNHLRSADFLDVEHHPQIVFKGTSVEINSDTEGILHGELTIRGITKPVALQVELIDVAQVGEGLWVAGFSARTRLNRHDFNVSWNRALEGGGLMLSDYVDIEIEVEARLKQPA